MVVVLLLFFLACGKPPESEQLRKTVVSWSATMALTARHWLDGQLPDHFVGMITDAAVDELGNQSRSSEAVPPALTASAARTIALAHDLDTAVDHHDRGAVARDAQALDTIAQGLR